MNLQRKIALIISSELIGMSANEVPPDDWMKGCSVAAKRIAALKSAERRKTVRPKRAVQQTQPAISALADKWCDSTNQPDNICVALYQFTKWAQKQQADA